MVSGEENARFAVNNTPSPLNSSATRLVMEVLRLSLQPRFQHGPRVT